MTDSDFSQKYTTIIFDSFGRTVRDPYFKHMTRSFCQVDMGLCSSDPTLALVTKEALIETNFKTMSGIFSRF